MTPVKEPSELDYALVRDLVQKLNGTSYIAGGSLSFMSSVSKEHLRMRAEALERIATYSSKMGDEITRLVLEKHQRD